MNLNKEINLNKKFIVIMILFTITSLGLYTSYAYFQVSVIQNNVVVIRTATIDIETSIDGYDTPSFTLASGESKDITVNLNNNLGKDIAYKMYYTITSGSNTFTAESTEVFTNNIVESTMNTSKTITFTFKNTGSSSITIKLGAQGGLVGFEIELEQGNELISSEKIVISAAQMIISKYGTEENLVAVNTDGTLYAGTGEIREYRYSGLTANNYAIFNDDGDSEIEANELWRIVGVFKNSSDEWNLKLMRNTILTSDEMPHTYTINGIAYTIDSIEDTAIDYDLKTGNLTGAFMAVVKPDLNEDPVEGEKTENYIYWNSTKVGTNYNDWTTAGLQYFLNTTQDSNGVAGYYSTFTANAKNLIDDNYTYYLGNVTSYDYETDDTAISAYNNERDEENIWEGNFPSWNGAIGLLYPSDYGYSADSSYWSGTILFNYNSAAAATSWMQQTTNHSGKNEWFLSPSADSPNDALYWDSVGDVLDIYIVDFGDNAGARPVLNLKSIATMEDAEGTETNPYRIIEG